MLRINIENVEELIFQNKEIWEKMPDLIYLRDQWRISKMTPVLRSLGKKSLLEFLRTVKKHHEESMSEHFKSLVTIDKIERHLVRNIVFSIEDDNDVMFDSHDTYTGFSVYRKNDKIHMTFWR
jgi:hypothetical protein